MEISATPRRWSVGDRVRVRRERWRVSAIGGDAACRFLTLEGLGPHNASEQRTFLEPVEIVEPLRPDHGGSRAPSELRWRSGRRRWRRTLRQLWSSVGPWTRLHSVDSADIDVLPHQLEPALAVLGGRGTRVLLADAVGLGKTVQAGVLLSELLRRGAAQSALVLTPAGLREQWQRELFERFGLRADIVDVRAMARLAWELPIGVNPWSTCSAVIASIDYVKRPEVLPAVHARAWDIVIVDEAHGVTPFSDRYAALAPLCRSALFVILLTATPHSGDRQAFAALRALGSLDPAVDDCLIFRRSRADVSGAPHRHVHVLGVRPSAAEARMHAALDRYADAVFREAVDTASATLLVSTLRKRALSSPHSLRASLNRRLHALDAPTAGPHADEGAGEQMPLPLWDDDESGELDDADLAPRLDGPGLTDVDRERALLERVRSCADDATTAETKLAALARLLRRLERHGEPAIVFTEYRDTLLHLRRTVAPGALVLHGGLHRIERRSTIDAFTGGSRRVLLATDAAGEGLNLHHTCRCVIHLELPWNPVRLEQRIGRVDRLGQRRTVHAFCLVSRHRTERQLLQRLAQRVAAADADIGMSSPLESHAGDTCPRVDRGPSGRSDEMAWRVEIAGAASVEAGRVRGARALRQFNRSRADVDAVVPAQPVPDHDRCAAVVARAHRRMRALLRGRALLIVEVVGLDGHTQAVASVARSVLLPRGVYEPWGQTTPGSSRTLVGSLGVMTTTLDGIVADLVADVRDHEPAFTEHAPFWAMASDRATAIARATSIPAHDLFQPGLFDRRAERIRRLRVDERAALADLMEQRLRRLEALGRASAVALGRVLLLLP